MIPDEACDGEEDGASVDTVTDSGVEGERASNNLVGYRSLQK